jgi:hypothetical protein
VLNPLDRVGFTFLLYARQFGSGPQNGCDNSSDALPLEVHSFKNSALLVTFFLVVGVVGVGIFDVDVDVGFGVDKVISVVVVESNSFKIVPNVDMSLIASACLNSSL